MNIKIKKDVLLKQLNYVIKGISSKNLKPILNCIKLEVTDKGLYLLSTDNDIAIQAFIDKKDFEPNYNCGQIVVSGKYLYDIIKEFPEGLITIDEVVDSEIFISTENESTNLKYSLICNDINEFPSLDIETNKNPILIKSKILKNLVNQTSFAASLQSTRPTITGINIQVVNNSLTFRATDSYRLAQKTVEIDNTINEEVNIIVPTKNMTEFTKMLEDDDVVEIHVFTNKVILIFSNLCVMSKLIEGSYPDVNKLIPQSYKEKLIVSSNEFNALLRRASLLSKTEDNKSVKLECNNNVLIAKANVPEIGKSDEKLTLHSGNHESFKIAFSSQYMIDAIKALESDEIEFLYIEDIKPIVLKNKDDDSLIQLVVPMKSY